MESSRQHVDLVHAGLCLNEGESTQVGAPHQIGLESVLATKVTASKLVTVSAFGEQNNMYIHQVFEPIPGRRKGDIGIWRACSDYASTDGIQKNRTWHKKVLPSELEHKGVLRLAHDAFSRGVSVLLPRQEVDLLWRESHGDCFENLDSSEWEKRDL